MNPAEEIPPEHAHRAYYRQPVWKRIVVIAAGPAVNIVLAFVILAGVFMSPGTVEPPPRRRHDRGRTRPPPATLQKGDEVLAVDGKRADRQLQRAARPGRQGRRRPQGHAGHVHGRARRPASETVSGNTFYDNADQALPLRLRLRPGRERTRPPARSAPRGLALDEMWTVTSSTRSATSRRSSCPRSARSSAASSAATRRPARRSRSHQHRARRARVHLAVAGHHQPVPVPAARRRAHLLGAGREGPRQARSRSASWSGPGSWASRS